jgi:hypothetical protein
LSPRKHQSPSSIKKVCPAICGLHAINQFVRKGFIYHLLRVLRLFSGPISEAASKAVDCGLGEAEISQNLRHGHVAEWLCPRVGEDKILVGKPNGPPPAEYRHGSRGERNHVLLPHLHAVRRDRPDGIVEVEFRPGRQPCLS